MEIHAISKCKHCKTEQAVVIKFQRTHRFGVVTRLNFGCGHTYTHEMKFKEWKNLLQLAQKQT